MDIVSFYLVGYHHRKRYAKFSGRTHPGVGRGLRVSACNLVLCTHSDRAGILGRLYRCNTKAYLYRTGRISGFHGNLFRGFGDQCGARAGSSCEHQTGTVFFPVHAMECSVHALGLGACGRSSPHGCHARKIRPRHDWENRFTGFCPGRFRVDSTVPGHLRRNG